MSTVYFIDESIYTWEKNYRWKLAFSYLRYSYDPMQMLIYELDNLEIEI